MYFLRHNGIVLIYKIIHLVGINYKKQILLHPIIYRPHDTFAYLVFC